MKKIPAVDVKIPLCSIYADRERGIVSVSEVFSEESQDPYQCRCGSVSRCTFVFIQMFKLSLYGHGKPIIRAMV